jgi:hypothetical protein
VMEVYEKLAAARCQLFYFPPITLI